MKYFNGIIIVEGTNDESFLSSYIVSEYLVLNGYEISDKNLDYLSNLHNRKVILLTDPDKAGLLIRQKWNNILPNLINVEVDISKCNKHEKHGIAECQISEIFNKLSSYLLDNSEYFENIKNKDLIEFGLLENKDKRNYLCKALHLGNCNNKTLIKRLNYNNISLDIIKEALKSYGN